MQGSTDRRFGPIFNPYPLHFGNIQERHLWKKNPKFTFWSLMTSCMVEYLWRHINLKLHQLGYLYVTWPKSRDVISVRYHVMKLITPENPGNELASFLEKKSKPLFKSGFIFQKWCLLISQKAVFGILAGCFFQEWRLLISRLLDFFPRFVDRG